MHVARAEQRLPPSDPRVLPPLARPDIGPLDPRIGLHLIPHTLLFQVSEGHHDVEATRHVDGDGAAERRPEAKVDGRLVGSVHGRVDLAGEVLA